MKTQLVFLSALVLLSPCLAISQENFRDRVVIIYEGDGFHPHDGFHEHDGFYLSASLGAGGMSYEDLHAPIEIKVSRAGASIADFKIGGAVIPGQLILSGDIIEVSANNPDASRNGVPGKYGFLNMNLLGLGITHYFMPANIFLSGTLGAGNFYVSGGGSSQRSDNGFGFQLKAGKEWWVSRDWGIGLSLAFLHLGIPDQSNNGGGPESLNGSFFGALFNTTFN